MFHPQRSINCKGKLLDLTQPQVMGILNVTPDSFFDGGHFTIESAVLQQVEKMLMEGAAIIDVGGMSSRPGATMINEEDELQRVMPVIELIMNHFPGTIISIDTIKSEVARRAVEVGASIINDISAGKLDDRMYETVADLGVPYVLMHMQGVPGNMQQNPVYEDIIREILDFLIQEVGKLRVLGVKDILLDVGFGFGKTVEHNYQLLCNLHIFQILDLPILAGLSRKSMVCRPLGIKPSQALNGTTALHIVALQQGARILRVHDVREAVEVIKLWQELEAVEKLKG
ncbi:MAG: dihydropteroate synthase [Saprospiraceae bacterium]|nr:dihydropteroate synthase [Saprospiraceae bacterium]